MLLQASFWNDPFLHNTVLDWVWAAALGTVAILASRPIASGIAKLVAVPIRRYTDGQHGEYFVALTRRPLAKLLGLGLGYLAIAHLVWPFDRLIIHRIRAGKAALDVTLMDVADRLFLLGIILAASLLLSRLLDFLFRVQMERAARAEERDRLQLLPLIRDMAKIGLWTLGAFWVLGAVFAVNIPALVAGLGIGGVAIALAAKETVENFFAAFTILTDKPFQTGEGIRMGDLEGTVERIGFRSTRIRHADGSVFIVPNQNLVDQKLENLSRRETRRIQLKVALKYSVSPEKLEQLINDIRGAVLKGPHVRDDVQVTLDSFNDSRVGLLVTYFLPQPVPDGEEDTIKQGLAMKIYALTNRYAEGAVTEPTPEATGKALDVPQSSSTDNP